MFGQIHSGLVMPSLKFAKTVPRRGVRHHVDVFDLAYGLSGNSNDPTQVRLRQNCLPSQRLEALGNFRSLPWPRVHFLPSLQTIVRQYKVNCNPATQVSQFGAQRGFWWTFGTREVEQLTDGPRMSRLPFGRATVSILAMLAPGSRRGSWLRYGCWHQSIPAILDRRICWHIRMPALQSLA